MKNKRTLLTDTLQEEVQELILSQTTGNDVENATSCFVLVGIAETNRWQKFICCEYKRTKNKVIFYVESKEFSMSLTLIDRHSCYREAR